ncbi:hypothetical protein M407DRAFT_243373 [Tulasnella calospora MUT 4182]|uniref:Uncharacterized protein n=1 Tax=Tulasnella calospora MUT 4182 TaxID=1051891 RepID=A0A0C3L0Y4_9AGAM|nr:hypothetical protein M407DRAFT_243373 [Tulasnella calospora MUT 4182]
MGIAHRPTRHDTGIVCTLSVTYNEKDILSCLREASGDDQTAVAYTTNHVAVKG